MRHDLRETIGGIDIKPSQIKVAHGARHALPVNRRTLKERRAILGLKFDVLRELGGELSNRM